MGKGATRDNGGGQLATKGPDKGKRKEGGTGKDPVRRKMTSNNRKMTSNNRKRQKWVQTDQNDTNFKNTDVQAHCAKLYKHVNRKGHHGSKGLNSKITMKTDLKTPNLNLKT